ncbi:MAG: hypothetical protein ACLQNE_31095 [Thermoguttaceae bacterium]
MNKQLQAQEPVDPWFLAEFGCWTMVVLAPILTWVNGPAVSTDQHVVRVAVFVLAATGAIGIRASKIVRRRWQRLPRPARDEDALE